MSQLFIASQVANTGMFESSINYLTCLNLTKNIGSSYSSEE